MHVWIEPVMNDSLGTLSNPQPPHLIVEMEDSQHVHVMPNLPSTCHPNKHRPTGKVTIGINLDCILLDLVVLLLDLSSLSRILVRPMFKVFNSCSRLGEISLRASKAFIDET